MKKDIANGINVNTNNPNRTSQICNNAMSTAIESIDDVNDARGNTVVANTSTTNAYPLTKNSNG